MKTRINVFCFAAPDSDEEKGYRVKVFSEDEQWHSYSDDIKLNEEAIPIGIDLPDLDEQELLLRAVATLREKQKYLLAEAERNRQKIEDKISKLLLLTHVPNNIADIK